MDLKDPKVREIATPTQRKVVDAMNKVNGNQVAAAKLLKMPRATVQGNLKNLRLRLVRQGYSPAHDMVHAVPDPLTLKRLSTNYDKDGGVKQQWVIAEPDKEKQMAAFQAWFDGMANELPRERPMPAPAKGNAALCNLMVFTDYHMGMLAWHKEGGANWDLKIAEKLLYDSFAYLVDAAPKAATMVLCLQGDFLHWDGLTPWTPTSHHVVDADGRFPKVVDCAIAVVRKVIRHALAKHERVHLVVCEGNHDEGSSMWMRKMFAALYEDEQRLSVDCSELPYYVYQHGETMLGFHHGHKVKNEALPMLFAAKYAKIWGNTTKRYAHCGHRHHVDEKEYTGMIVTQHPTLTAPDAYSARGGWISERAACLTTYHVRYGKIGTTVACPEMFDEAA
jgi:hypothetical protein